MPRGASFHLKAVRAPAAARIHNTRDWTDEHPAPAYMLPDEVVEGYWRELAVGDPETAQAEKLAMASGKARAMATRGQFSPVWEGVLNLPHPVGDGSDRATMGAMVRAFVDGYERITGHRVLTADVHLDEGRMEPDGATILNPHAHIVVDRTDGRGRPIRLNKDQLRKVQDLAATATGLDRGEDATVTRRRHLPHQAYRGLAKAGRVQSREDAEEAQELAEEARTTAELYGELRGLLKASGRATQADYQTAKAKREDRAWIAQQIAGLERALQVQHDRAQAAAADRDRAQEAAERDQAARRAAEAERDQAQREAAAAAARPPVVREVVREVVPEETRRQLDAAADLLKRQDAELERRPAPEELRLLATHLKTLRQTPNPDATWTRSYVRGAIQQLEQQSNRGRGSGRG